MNRPRVRDEIQSRPRISGEEFGRQHVTLLAVAPSARQYDIAGGVRATVRQRVDVIECREVELERRCAVDAASSAITHRGALDRSFLLC
jgi:hypothetical protein